MLAGLTLHEGCPRQSVAGSVVGFAGVVVIGLTTSSRAGADAWGVPLCLVAAASCAIGVATQEPLLARTRSPEAPFASCFPSKYR